MLCPTVKKQTKRSWPTAPTPFASMLCEERGLQILYINTRRIELFCNDELNVWCHELELFFFTHALIVFRQLPEIDERHVYKKCEENSKLCLLNN